MEVKIALILLLAAGAACVALNYAAQVPMVI